MRAGRLAVLCVLVWIGGTTAKDWPVARGPARDPNPYTYNAKDWQTVPKDFTDDATACHLRAASTQIIEPDGTIESITHEVTRLNSRKAVEELGEHRTMIFAPDYEKLTLNIARVHKADGTIIEIEPKHVQLRDSATDYLVYAADKQVIITFPNLVVGDVIEVKWTTRGRNPEYQGHLFTRYGFGEERYPIVRDVYQVMCPNDKPLKYALFNTHRGDKDFKPEIVKQEKQTIYTWTAKDCRPLPAEDYAPSREEGRLSVAVSTMQTWDDVLQWKRAVRAKCWECTLDLKKIVKEVTANLKTPEQQAQALTYWVRRNIRYISAGERHDYTPHTPAAVVKQRYGDCKDTSQLLAVLLKEAGIHVGLVSLGIKGDGHVLEAVPSPWGTHAILVATINGKEHWIDTTATLCGWNFLPSHDRDRVAYVVDDNGLRLTRTPKLTADENRIEQTSRIRVQANGDSVVERTQINIGHAAHVRRDDFIDVPAGERRRLLASELQDANNKSRLKSLDIDEVRLQAYDAPVQLRAVFEVPNHLSGGATREGSLTDSPLWARLLSINVDPDRKQALDLNLPFVSHHRMIVEVPFGRRLTDAPSNREAKSAWGTFKRTVKVDPTQRSWTIELHTRLEQTRVEPADLEAFRQWQESIAQAYRVYFTMVEVRGRKEAQADARELAKIVAKNPDDVTAAIMLVRLHDRAGDNDAAAKAADAALAKHPTHRELLEVAAETAQTSMRAEQLWQRLIAAYPKEPKYAVQLGRDLVSFDERVKARDVLTPLTAHADRTTKAEAYYQLARLELLEQQPERARKAFTEATVADDGVTDHYDGHVLSGKIDEAAGQYRAAAKAYEAALESDNKRSEPWRLLATVQLRNNQKSAARDTLRQWFILCPAATLEDRAVAADMYLQLENEGEALEYARAALKGDRASLAQRVIGIIMARRGQWSDALAALLEVQPADYTPDVFRAWVNTVVQTGELPKLASGPGKLLSTVPSTTETIDLLKLLTRSRMLRNALPKEKGTAADQFVCAEMLYQQGRLPDAERLLAAALRDAPDMGSALALRGLINLERGRLSKALPDAERAIKQSPDEATGYYVRGRIKLERQTAGALDDLKKAAELGQQRDGRVLYWLATAYHQAAQPDAARRTAEAAKKLLPNDADLTDLLKTLPEKK